MKKTKLLTLLFSVFLILGFTACSKLTDNIVNNMGNGNNDSDNNDSDNNDNRTKVDGKIGDYGYPYEVGDIVFKDGSASRPSEDFTDAQKAAAIAVIFYKGNDLNSDDAEGNAVTDKERILGVGLSQYHYSSGEYWGTGYGAYRAIESIQCAVRGTAGNWVISGDKDGHDNLYQMAVELKSDNDIYATVDNYYRAFLFALHYADKTTNQLKNTAYENGWYLPSIAELYYLWKKVTVVNEASKLCGGEAFGESESSSRRTYWSSSKSTDEAEVYTFSFNLTGNKYNDCKINSVPRDTFINNLCAIRDFTEGATTPDIPRPDAEEGKLGLYGKPYEVNDIMLNDGSVIPYKPGLVLTDEQKAAVESIIYYAGSEELDGTNEWPLCALGLGLDESDEKLKWCISDAHFYSASFSDTECAVNGEAGAHTFTIKSYGSSVMGEHSLYDLISGLYYYNNDKNNPTEYYPAICFAGYDDPALSENLASIQFTSYPPHWILPTIGEMFWVWKDIDDLNEVLEFLEGDPVRTDETYWSSSQSTADGDDESKKVWTIDMSNGDCSGRTDKTEELYTRRVRIYDNCLYSHY